MTLPRSSPAAAILFSAALSSFASGGQGPLQAVQNVERQWTVAIADGNRTTYDALLTADFTWTFVSGRMIGRDEVIASVGPVTVSETPALPLPCFHHCPMWSNPL